MNKQEFLLLEKDFYFKMHELQEQLNRLNREKYEMTENYIEEHRIFQNGDAVTIKTDGKEPVNVFVSSAYEYDGVVKYNFIKMKKDGTPGAHKHYVDSFDERRNMTIELIHSDYRGKNTDGTPIEETKKD